MVTLELFWISTSFATVPPHYGTILEVPKCENGQKVTKKEAKPGKIVLFMKITSFFVCQKFFFFFKVDTMTYFDDSTIW